MDWDGTGGQVLMEVQRALQMLHEVDSVLEQLGLFWANSEVSTMYTILAIGATLPPPPKLPQNTTARKKTERRYLLPFFFNLFFYC